MLKSTRRYLNAAASVMDIMPSTDYMKMVAKSDGMSALRGDYIAIASDMKRVVDVVGQEVGKQAGNGERRVRYGHRPAVKYG